MSQRSDPITSIAQLSVPTRDQLMVASSMIMIKKILLCYINIFLVKSFCLTYFCVLCSVFHNCESVVTVTPTGKAVTYVNGIVITEATVLHHVSTSSVDVQHHGRFVVLVFFILVRVFNMKDGWLIEIKF